MLVYRFQADTFMKKNETGIVIALCAVVQVTSSLLCVCHGWCVFYSTIIIRIVVVVIIIIVIIQARVHSNSSAKVYDPFKPNEFPKATLQSPDLCAALAEIGDSIRHLRRTAEEENKLVYFKSVPKNTTELPELPSPTELNLPCAPYEPPQSQVVAPHSI